MTTHQSNILFDHALVDGRYLVAEQFASRTEYKVSYVKKQLRSSAWQGKKLFKKWYVDWVWWCEEMRNTPDNGKAA